MQPPRSRRLSGWRKLAGAMWSAPSDPQFYGDMEVDAAAVLTYVDALRRSSGVHVTPTHVAVKAVGRGLQAVPALNVRLTRQREHPRASIDVFVVVAVDDNELTGMKVCDVDQKSVVQIAREMEQQAERIRLGEDEQLGRTKQVLEALPPRLLRAGMRLSAWLTSDRRVDLASAGLPRDAFGSAVVSSIGGTGITHAYSPLAPYYRVPLLVLVGAVREQAVVVSGTVVARPILTLTGTFDHRYADGLLAAQFAHAVAAFLRDPAAADVSVAVPAQRSTTEAPVST